MIAIQEIKEISRESLPSVLVLSGEDAGQYTLLKKALFEAIGYDPSDLTMSYFDMTETEFESVAVDLESLPFLADEKVILMDQLIDLSTQKKRRLSDEDLVRLEAYLEHPLESNRLILLVPGKLDGKRRLVKLLKRDARVIEANPLSEKDLKTYLQQELMRLEVDVAPGVMDLLFIKSNGDFATGSQYVDFLHAYKPHGQITAEDVDQALPKTLQDNLFDLTQLVLAGQVDEARSLVQDLRLQGEDEIKLLAIMLSQFRIFLQSRLLYQEKHSEQAVVAQLSELLGRKINPYQVKFSLRDSRSLSIPQLKALVSLLIETDLQMKTGVFEKSYLFDLCLLKMIRISRDQHSIT